MTLDRIVRGGQAVYRHSVVTTLKTVGVPSMRATLPSGIHMNIGTNDILARRVWNERSFERAVRDAITNVLHAGMNVVDIGANIGYYSILAARLIGPEFRVLAVEPQPAVVRKLQQNIALNGITNIEVAQAALSNVEGPMDFFVPEPGMESHGSLRANGTFDAREKVTVQARLLDRLLAERGFDSVGLIKMDAEGAELPIIEGAKELLSSPRRPHIVFESAEINSRPFGYSVFDLLKRIHEFGYELRQLDEADWMAIPKV
ncbi:MAG: methyltransferase FkbM family [Bryobacterales bacterium]|nr:methyltransferase FkbM family [Bryobacterales bacterium]